MAVSLITLFVFFPLKFGWNWGEGGVGDCTSLISDDYITPYNLGYFSRVDSPCRI